MWRGKIWRGLRGWYNGRTALNVVSILSKASSSQLTHHVALRLSFLILWKNVGHGGEAADNSETTSEFIKETFAWHTPCCNVPSPFPCRKWERRNFGERVCTLCKRDRVMPRSSTGLVLYPKRVLVIRDKLRSSASARAMSLSPQVRSSYYTLCFLQYTAIWWHQQRINKRAALLGCCSRSCHRSGISRSRLLLFVSISQEVNEHGSFVQRTLYAVQHGSFRLASRDE